MIDINNMEVNRWYEYYADKISYLDILHVIKVMWVLYGELIPSECFSFMDMKEVSKQYLIISDQISYLNSSKL